MLIKNNTRLSIIVKTQYRCSKNLQVPHIRKNEDILFVKKYQAAFIALLGI